MKAKPYCFLKLWEKYLNEHFVSINFLSYKTKMMVLVVHWCFLLSICGFLCISVLHKEFVHVGILLYWSIYKDVKTNKKLQQLKNPLLKYVQNKNFRCKRIIHNHSNILLFTYLVLYKCIFTFLRWKYKTSLTFKFISFNE